MEPGISIITLAVSGLQQAVSFYRDSLGLPLRDGSGEGIAFFQTSSTWLALFPREQFASEVNLPEATEGFKGFTLARNVRIRDEVDRVLAEALAAGATIVKPVQDASWGGYSGYFADPDEFPWEVAWNPQFWVE